MIVDVIDHLVDLTFELLAEDGVHFVSACHDLRRDVSARNLHDDMVKGTAGTRKDFWHQLVSRADNWPGGTDPHDRSVNLAAHNEHRNRRGLDEVRVLVTLGPVHPGELELPRNAAETPFAPHDQILPEAALMVSHVGHGSLCAAARHGVPILAMPLGRDQNANAETLTDIGIGSWLPPSSAPTEIADVARRLLSDQTIQRRCAEVAEEISTHAGLDTAVQLITGPSD